MKASLLFIIFMIAIDIYGLSSSLVNSQIESCSSNINLNGSVSFNTTSLHCLSVWDSQGFILRYSQTASNDSNLWSFVLSAPDTTSYIAMAFSTTGAMVGSSAIVGWVSSDGAGVVKQYHLGGTSPRLVVPDQGSLKVISNSTAIISQSSRLYMAFQLETDGDQQPQSRLLYSVGPTGAFPSAPNYVLSEHQVKVSTSLNYVTGQSSSSQGPYVKLRRSHGVLNMIGWGILMIIGAIVARYFKQKDPTWFYLHTSIQLLGFVLGIIGIVCGFILKNRLNAHVNTHKGIGIFILVLGCLQIMAFLARPGKESKLRKYWNWYHQNVGRILIIFTIANIFYGIHLGGEGRGWNAGYGAVLCVLFVTTVVLELRIWIRK